MDVIKLVFGNREFWTLLVLFLAEIKKYVLPDFPDPIWTSGVALFLFVVTVLFVKDKLAERKDAKLVKATAEDGEGY